jgi:hypothetical protein
MELLEKLHIQHADAAAVTLHNWLSERSVALLLREQPDQLEIGSGVCIQVGERYLVSTVAHNIENLDTSKIEVVPVGARAATAIAIRRFGSRSSVGSSTVDVGWIELEPEDCQRSRAQFISLEHIHPLDHEEGRRACILQGYPAATVDVSAQYSERPLVESDGLLTLSIPPAARRGRHRPGFDIAVEYPPHDKSLDESRLPPPPGLSGGGLWLVPTFEERQVWSPEHSRLIGIQRGWRRAEKEAVCTRVEHWLDLVATDIAETREPIAHARQRWQPLTDRPSAEPES